MSASILLHMTKENEMKRYILSVRAWESAVHLLQRQGERQRSILPDYDSKNSKCQRNDGNRALKSLKVWEPRQSDGVGEVHQNYVFWKASVIVMRATTRYKTGLFSCVRALW